MFPTLPQASIGSAIGPYSSLLYGQQSAAPQFSLGNPPLLSGFGGPVGSVSPFGGSPLFGSSLGSPIGGFSPFAISAPAVSTAPGFGQGNAFGFGNGLGNSGFSLSQGNAFAGQNMMFSILNNLMSMMLSMFSLLGNRLPLQGSNPNATPGANSNSGSAGTAGTSSNAGSTAGSAGSTAGSGSNAGNAGNGSSTDATAGSGSNSNAGNSTGGTYNPPAPPPPPVYNPPPPPSNKVLGSAGLFGDPQFGVFTPNLGNGIPNELKGFESGIKANQTVTLLNDADKGGLNLSVTGVQVDPANALSTGIGTAVFKSGNDSIQIGGNGDLLVNGVKKGNINDAGLIAPIKVGNLTVSTSQEIDGAGGVKAERFVIDNGEYKITAAARKPHADSNGYLDMNFEELVDNAADNASGYQASIAGLTQKWGIVDLLKLEPDAHIPVA